MRCPKCRSDNPDSAGFCGTCGMVLNLPSSATKTLETPTRRLCAGAVFADRYEVLGELGKGGMGVVYHVRDRKLDEEMALKILKPDIAAHQETIDRFKNELKFARRIAHRNVCKMYDLNEGEKILFITMEYVKGQDLKSLVRDRGMFAEKEVLETAKQICDGLAEAHALGVIHRDLKPQNVMVDEKGTAKIMDFGIARSVEAPGMTQTGMMIGTPDYISPEQAEGEKADQRSDIYSLGGILYEMVTGKPPFRGDTALSVAIKHKTQAPPDPREINPRLTDGMGRLILKCMEKDPARRYQTAKEVLVDLGRIEKGLPIAKAAPLQKKLEINWKRVLIYGGAALLLALLIAGALSLFRPRLSSIAVLPFKNLTGDPGQDYFADGITDGLIMYLGRLGALRVISFYTVMNLKNEKKPLAEIARNLRADVLVEGTVQQAGTRVGIRTRLIKAIPEERNLWEETYDRTMTDVLSMYGDVAQAIGREIKVKLKPQEKDRLASARQVNPETYKSYVKGMMLINGSTQEEFNQGLKILREAVEKDPADPLVYLGLAEAYVYLGHSPASPPDAWQQARAAAERALKLDPNLAEAVADLADVKLYYERDWKGAEQYFLRAMELNPSLPWNHYHYAWYLALFGRYDEAVKEHKRAQELDPLTPIHTGWLGGLYYETGEYDRAIEEAQKCLKSNENYALGWLITGYAYAGKQMYPEAIAAHRKAVEIEPWWKYALARTYVQAGKREEARKILAELEKEEPSAFGAFALAVTYTALGENDKAFQALEFQPNHAWIPWFRTNPQFFPLRGDPRFKELLRKYNLPDVK